MKTSQSADNDEADTEAGADEMDNEGDAQQDVCPECGMAKEDWPEQKGFRQEGQHYCCQGCADGSGCTCG